ncbi:MAG: glyoxalase [Lachnospiraceae bacterium]
MNEYDEMCVKYFLEHQGQLFSEKVAENMEEAEMFLEDCMAVICENISEVRDFFEEEGADIAEMTNEDLEEAQEVFSLPDGRYLIVEG